MSDPPSNRALPNIPEPDQAALRKSYGIYRTSPMGSNTRGEAWAYFNRLVHRLAEDFGGLSASRLEDEIRRGYDSGDPRDE